ncbi:hypothetical protein DFH08DRAFT_1009750 [Mycena albidolilacea]|uniref:Uncharacterized protein n=1 Tax=Mycena albidolilacea TaxID=1033008 RepID=A0AAD7EQ18_9AGAR|nr:hypothetical protein DFH08DRAFT_1009750 [Mycena albidolilacea]
MEDDNRADFEHLQSLAEDDDFHAGDMPNFPEVVNVGDILMGTERAELSHAGGEFASLEEDIEGDWVDETPRKREDWRTRRDRTELRNRAFLSQMPEMVSAYIRMCAESEMPARPRSESRVTVEEVYEIQVVDMFETAGVDVKLDPRGNGVVPALILAEMIPCAPDRPTVAVKVRVLEVYRVAHVHCPQLAIQSFVKSLCDLHGALGRDSKWRLKHACPACTYKLEGEDALIFDMLTCFDGNDSLKRVLQRDKVAMVDSETGEPVLGKSSERVDNRDAGDGYFLLQERVEKWVKDRVADRLPMQAAGKEEDNPCADRWKNMINDVTSKMWGIFDETGIFLALCRHGFVLVIADMIRSGELAKYPLAVVEELLDAFGMNLRVGYDVGCHFGATVANSSLGDEAWEKNLKCLVGSFHGHAHNRLCQLRFLATYVEGMGLEDLEGCERFFSRSNGLAKSCRYASRFHRQQEISTYAKHFDSFETYANLSKFLCSNYRQALTILKTEGALQTWMQHEGVDSVDRFHEWLTEERSYLEGLKDAAKTNEETLEMEYVQKLVNLSASQGADGTYTPGVSKEDRARRRAQEKVEKDLERVEELEEALDVVERWTTESAKWGATVEEIKRRKYAVALNALELLIVERIFELTKMNQSQTGYKMRKHIAKALQARSKAVRAAIDRYNEAAGALNPPMPSITWEQVVEYAFLADFDILRDTRAEVQSKPWTRPAYRLAMDHYFKILRACEEIKRLNVEIPRVVTWIRDENRFLRKMERILSDGEGKSDVEKETDGYMAVQVRLYHQRRGRFDAGHLKRFHELARMPGFTGSLRCGVAVERREDGEDEMDVDDELAPGMVEPHDPQAQGSDDEGDEAGDQAVSGLLY